MWVEAKKSGGSGGGASIEYVGEIASATGYSSAKTVNFKTGTYARTDYAELTTDNFIVLPVRSSSYKSKTSSTGSGGSAGGWTAIAYVANKNHEYNQSTGDFKFYGGYGASANQGGSARCTVTDSINYKIYIVKPGISTFES